MSGGAGIAVVDACVSNGLEVANFSQETYRKLRKIFPDWMDVNNPADMWPAGMKHGYQDTFKEVAEIVLEDPQVDALICITAAHKKPEDDSMDVSGIINQLALKKKDKFVTVWTFGAYQEELAALIEKDGVVVAYPSPERAARALAALYYSLHQERPSGKEDYIFFNDISENLVLSIFRSYVQEDVLLELKALELLKAYGIPSILPYVAKNKEEAKTIAREIGFPLLIRKATALPPGNVPRWIKVLTEREIERAYKDMFELTSNMYNATNTSTVLMQKYSNQAIEVFVGSRLDPNFGPVISLSLGGVYSELDDCIASRIAPLTVNDIREMLVETKLDQILGGVRGKKAANRDALVEAILRLAQLAKSYPQIDEIILSPLLVDDKGVLAIGASPIIKK